MNVSQILKVKGAEVISANVDDTLYTAIQTLTENCIGAMPVMNAGELVGIISERDLVAAIAKGGADILDSPIEDLMTCDLITCSLSDSVEDLMEVMTKSRVRHLPVVNKGNMVGIVSIGDVVKERLAETEREAEALKSYISNG